MVRLKGMILRSVPQEAAAHFVPDEGRLTDPEVTIRGRNQAHGEHEGQRKQQAHGK